MAPQAPLNAEKITKIFINGDIRTLNPKNPRAEAIAISGQTIVALGSNSEISRLRPPGAEILDLAGSTTLPAFTETHGHLVWAGITHLRLNLTHTQSLEEVLYEVKKEVLKLKPGEWLRGFGWDHNKWPGNLNKIEPLLPSASELSSVSPNNPVLLTRIDGGHCCWANELALKMADLDENSPDPDGGTIIKNERGKPSGILIDFAGELVASLAPKLEYDSLRHATKLAVKEALSFGVGTYHDLSTSAKTLEVFVDLKASGELGCRLYGCVDSRVDGLVDRFLESGPLTDPLSTLQVRAIKLFADGALGSKGAAMFEAYENDPDNFGLLILDEEKIYSLADKCLGKGFQLRTHAIGDRSNHHSLNAYERAFKKHGLKYKARTEKRFTIEHAQILKKQDIPRFGKLGIIPSMQATHCTSDMKYIYKMIGEKRAETGAYAWQDLRRSGARLVGGSDSPVETVNPLWGIFANCTRKAPIEKGQPVKDWKLAKGWTSEQVLTREEAIATYTVDAAYASFEEDIKGSLAPGKLADFVSLDRDIFSCPDEELLDAKVLKTFVGGNPIPL